MEEQELISKGKVTPKRSYQYLKIFIVSSIICIPMIIFGVNDTRRESAGLFFSIPDGKFFFGIIFYGISLIFSVISFFTEHARLEIEKKGEYNEQKASIVRMYSVVAFIVVYKIIVNIETLFDYWNRGEFRYIGSVLFLPDIAIIIISIGFLREIFINRIILLDNFEKTTLYRIIFVMSLVILWSLFDLTFSIFGR